MLSHTAFWYFLLFTSSAAILFLFHILTCLTYFHLCGNLWFFCNPHLIQGDYGKVGWQRHNKMKVVQVVVVNWSIRLATLSCLRNTLINYKLQLYHVYKRSLKLTTEDWHGYWVAYKKAECSMDSLQFTERIIYVYVQLGLLVVTIWLELCISHSSSCHHHLHHS